MSIERVLERIFEADQQALAAESEFLKTGTERDRSNAVSRAIEASARITDRAEATIRLKRLADLCAQIAGPAMADGLVQILDHSEQAVRLEAGRALLDLGYERYAEVARAIERALGRGSQLHALAELPWILAEIGEPSALPLIRQFLRHPDASVVASAIEAIAELGDEDAAADLCAFASDPRVVEVDDRGRSTIGELAQEAMDALAPEEADD